MDLPSPLSANITECPQLNDRLSLNIRMFLVADAQLGVKGKIFSLYPKSNQTVSAIHLTLKQ